MNIGNSAIGAAYASFTTFSVSEILVFLYQNKYDSMPWATKDK